MWAQQQAIDVDLTGTFPQSCPQAALRAAHDAHGDEPIARAAKPDPLCVSLWCPAATNTKTQATKAGGGVQESGRRAKAQARAAHRKQGSLLASPSDKGYWSRAPRRGGEPRPGMSTSAPQPDGRQRASHDLRV